MKIEILKLSFQDLRDELELGFEDPYRLCHLDDSTRRALIENPFCQTDRELALLVGTVDGCAAGIVLFVPGEILVAGKPHSIAWCSGLYVVPEFRSTLLGISLIREAGRSYKLVGGSRVADDAFKIFSRLGWIGIPLVRYLMPRRGEFLLTRLLGRGRATAMIKPLLDLALNFHRWLLEQHELVTCRGLDLEAVDSMSVELDPALALLNEPFGGCRSSRWLNWVLHHSFVQDPTRRKELFVILNREFEVVAYVVTRIKPYLDESLETGCEMLIGSVVDWGVLNPEAVNEKQIWLMATNRLTKQGVDVVEICCACPDAPVPLGNRKHGLHRMVLLSSDEGLISKRDQEFQWTFRQIDGDSGLS